MVNIALRAARLAAEQIVRATERLDLIKAEQAGAATFINDLCQQAERTIVHTLQKAYPHHTLVGEYTGRHKAIGDGPTPCEWQITVIDNLHNFSNAVPSFALSLTGRIKDKVAHALILNPITGEEFTASRGEGAQLNGKRLRASTRKDLDGALIGTGFLGRKSDVDGLDTQVAIMRELISAGATPFNTGSVALNLAYTAAGRLDGFCQLGLNSSEQDAGLLLLQEAGALVGDTAGGSNHRDCGKLVAGNPKIFKALLKMLRPALSQ
ncbi:inositol monophosphatase [Marinobacterium sp. D7]|uniref:inositol monophosphatase family protein n=1 Tax=Marinobacterium ramblicola TaxID=2849041 RepID=UPI001C2D26D2|nr:inositol monophosphatase family protein [Marinobacterium ramblicola]MBV1790512.1 inositol monophosphatase [Marinobacterium ramblicola]